MQGKAVYWCSGLRNNILYCSNGVCTVKTRCEAFWKSLKNCLKCIGFLRVCCAPVLLISELLKLILGKGEWWRKLNQSIHIVFTFKISVYFRFAEVWYFLHLLAGCMSFFLPVYPWNVLDTGVCMKKCWHGYWSRFWFGVSICKWVWQRPRMSTYPICLPSFCSYCCYEGNDRQYIVEPPPPTCTIRTSTL